MLSIVIATVVSMIIGSVWFGPKTLYPVMIKEMNISEEDQKARMENFKPGTHFGIVILGEFTLATILYGLLMITNGDISVLLFPALFVVLSNIKTNVFTFLNFKLFLIQEGEKVVSILAMGLIIAVMM